MAPYRELGVVLLAKQEEVQCVRPAAPHISPFACQRKPRRTSGFDHPKNPNIVRAWKSRSSIRWDAVHSATAAAVGLGRPSCPDRPAAIRCPNLM